MQLVNFNYIKALLLMCLAMLSSPIVGAAVKIAGEAGIPNSMIVCIRSVFGFLAVCFCLPMLEKGTLRSVQPFALFGRGLCVALAVAAYFYTLPRMPLANATLIHHASPLFIPLFGVVMLSEKMRLHHFIWLFFGFAGAYLAARPEGWDVPVHVFVIGMFSTILAAYTNVWGKKLMVFDTPFTLMFYLAATMSVVSLIWVSVSGDWQWLSWHVIGLLAFAGLYGNIAQILAMMAYRYVHSSYFGLLTYLSIPVSTIAGILIFDEIPGVMTLCGITLILFAIIASTIVENRQEKNRYRPSN